MLGITYGGGNFLAVRGCSFCGFAPPAIVTSTDGTTWVGQSGVSNSLRGIIYGNREFVAVGGPGWGDSYDRGMVANSSDGVHWNERQLPIEETLRGVTYGNGHFVAVGDFGAILESGSIVTLDFVRDPVSKRLKLSLTGPPQSAYSLQTSTDLLSWQTLTNFSSGQFSTVILDNLPATGSRSFYRAQIQ
jgi:hypothetical protein